MKILFQVRTGAVQVLLATALSLTTARMYPAQLLVPSEYTNVSAAYVRASPGETNFIVITPGLYLEPLARFDAGTPVVLSSVGGRVILASTNPPPNDTPGGALALTGRAVSTFAYNFSAHREPDEPSHQGYTNFSRSMWWAWSPPTDGQAIFAVADYEFRPLLGVFRSSNGVPVSLPVADFLWRSNTEASLVVSRGTNYLIRVAADGGGYGGIGVYVVMPEPPPNDLRTHAFELSGHRARVVGNTYAASDEIGEPVHAQAGAGRSVWYFWTAPTNTGWGNHPLTATTAGSDFDTVLAVYTTNGADTLDLVVSNDNVSSFERYSRVTFVPQPATTYFFALDGAGPRYGGPPQRSFVGNYSLRLDYSWVNFSNRVVSFVDSNDDGWLNMLTEFVITHHGFVPVGPLRIRVAARATNTLSGIHLLNAAHETNLLAFPVTLSSSGPGGYTLVRTNFVRPPPFYPVDDEHLSFWGVFAILEEQNDTNWLHVDSDFVGFGDEIPPGGDGGLNFGVGRFFQPLTETESSVVESTTIVGPAFATDHSTAEIVVTATISFGSHQRSDETNSLLPVRWLAPTNFPIASSGTSAFITIGDLPHSTNITIDAEVNIGGLPYPPQELRLPIYKRPQLAVSREPPGAFLLTLFTEPLQRYRIEWTPALAGTNTTWLPLGTNWFFATNGTCEIRVPAQGSGGHFYRAILLP